MFGLFVNKILFFIFLSLPYFVQAAEKAIIINDGAMVYKNADFDSPVIEHLPLGKSYDISSNKYSEAFYRIRVRTGVIGYIADTDVETNAQAEKKKKEPKKKKTAQKEPKKKEKEKRPLVISQYAGIGYSQIYFREDTMGLKPTANLGFLGFHLSGPDMVIAGPAYTTLNILFHQGAPKYYETATGKEANGFVFIADFLFQTVAPLGNNAMYFYGLGPMFRFSKFNVKLVEAGVNKDYVMQDMLLGATFNLGAGFRIGDAALRFEGQYYWEKMQYWGMGAAVQLPF